MLTTITVNDLRDVIDPDPQITTLREAVLAANADADTILFSTDPADGLDGATILLSQGQLSITKPVTIDASMLDSGITIDAGGGANGVVGDGDGTSVFEIILFPEVDEIQEVTLDGLTITGGDTLYTGGGIYFVGGIFDTGGSAKLNIHNSVIKDNFAVQNGGGVFHYSEIGFVGSSGDRTGWTT